MKFKKIIAGVTLGTVMVSGLALAATETQLPRANQDTIIYKVAEKVVEYKLDMSLEDIRSEIQAGTLKETLEAKGIDVEKFQSKFRKRIQSVLELNGVDAQLTETEAGLQISLTSEKERFLNRLPIMQARADYLNQTVEKPLEFKVSQDGNTITINIDGESEEAVKTLKDKFLVN